MDFETWWKENYASKMPDSIITTSYKELAEDAWYAGYGRRCEEENQ